MKWELLTEAEADAIVNAGGFPWAGPGEVGFVLNREEGPQWLIRRLPITVGESQRPVCFLETTDLEYEKTWRLLLSMAPAHPVDLAAFSRLHPEIKPGVFLNLLGQKIHYKSLADWQELGELDEPTRTLARELDYPLPVLRLWNRLKDGHRGTWLELRQTGSIKRNVFREIIQDFYDLNDESREAALGECLALAARAGEKQLRGDEIREIIRHRRYPRSQEVFDQVNELKKALPRHQGIRLEIPPYLEGDRLTLQLQFSSLSDFDRLSEQIRGEDIRQVLARILELL